MLPDPTEISKNLGFDLQSGVSEILEGNLLLPLRNLLARPGKSFRGRLVEVGWILGKTDPEIQLSSEERSYCDAISRAIEYVHAGSLIIDDIEDGSINRRGLPSLHILYGTPVALNAGNWLYFWPFQIIQKLGLPEKTEISLYKKFHETLLQGHYGQALDL